MTTGDDHGGARPGQVHVSELLAAHGRTVAPSGRRRRRAEPAAVVEAPVVEAPALMPQDLHDPEIVRDDPAPEVAAARSGQVHETHPAEPAPLDTVTPDDARPLDTVTPDAPRNPAREWALVGAQLVGALVGGALLWFGFRRLWEWQSVVALVLSAVVIVGLVVVVRVLRRAEDLFSTVLAVLAGLIVTVSPPVLTLTGR